MGLYTGIYGMQTSGLKISTLHLFEYQLSFNVLRVTINAKRVKLNVNKLTRILT